VSHRITLLALLFSTTVTAAMEASPTETDILSIQQETAAGITLHYRSPAVELRQVEVEGRQFQRIDVTSDALIGAPGGPALPAWSRWVEIPHGVRPILNSRSIGRRSILDIDVAPFPCPTSDNPDQQPGRPFDPDAYSRDTFLPEAPAEISTPLTIGSKRWALVDITPYSYNPVRRELRYYEGLEVEITLVPAKAGIRSARSRPVIPADIELERALSSGPPDRDDLSGRIDILGHYVIVVADNDELVEALEPLVEWKQRMGYMVTVVTLEETGDSEEELWRWLQTAWNEWEAPPTFVLLGGDATGDTRIPYFRSENQQPWQSWYISDHHFVCWEGILEGDNWWDWIPQGFVGRLAINSVEELEEQVAKILGYEMEPFTEEPWVEGALLIANGVHSCQHTKVAIREMMTRFGYDRDNIIEEYDDWWSDNHSDHNVISEAVDEGVGFVNFRGYNDWGTYTTFDIHQRRNGWKLPIVTGIVCETNDFANRNNGPEKIGEAWQRAWGNHEPAGAVACYGPTDLYTWTWFNNTIDVEFYHTLLNRDVHTLGVLCLASKLTLLRTYPSARRLGDGHTVGYYFYTYHLLGDPGLQVWTREPSPIEADFAAELPVGITMIEVLVSGVDEDPAPGAYVHIYREDETHFGAYTDDEGTVVLAVPPLEAGDYLLTVTGPNMIPILDSFEVVEYPVYISLDDTGIDDDEEDDSRGNGDGAVNSGETIELTLNLRNHGTDRSEAFTAVLQTDSPWMEMGQGEVDYDPLDAGQTAAGQTPFVFSLSPETPDGEPLEFDLAISHGEEQWQSAFILPAVGYRFQIVEFQFVEDDLYPGTERQLLVTMMNVGDLDAAPLTATLECDNPYVQIRQSESPIDAIPRGESRDNSEHPFEVFAGPNAYQGSEVSFGLALADEDGLRDSLILVTTLGLPAPDAPQGPDMYGYWAYDSRDTASGMAPEFDWIEAEEQLDNLDDPYVQPQTQPWYNSDHGSRVFFGLPFDFTYYGERYGEITIGSNGWLSFGRTDLIAWNTQALGSPLAPPAMVCPFWNDLWNGDVYTSFEEEEARLVVEWRDYNNENGSATFEVILYDPTVAATSTGDGEIVFQYQKLPRLRDQHEEQATIGICSPDREDGLLITHAKQWDPRTGGLTEDMAVRFSTGPFTHLGGIRGRVAIVEDDSPLEEARVMLDGTGFFDRTDAEGNYLIEGVPVGMYSATAYKRSFNEDNAADVEIIEDEVAVVNFELTHPTFNADIEEIDITVPPDSTGEVGFTVWNDGNGPLEYRLQLDYEAEPPEGRDEPWELLFNLQAEDTTGDTQIQGVTFDGEFLYLAGRADPRDFPKKVYVLDREGALVRKFDQYTIDSSSYRGYCEIDWNGQNLLGIEKNNIVEITREGELVRSFGTPDQYDHTIAYSPQRGTVFTKEMTGRTFYELDLDGNIAAEYPIVGERMRSQGLAWFTEDEEGYPLYILCEYPDPPPAETYIYLMKMNPETGDYIYVRDINLDPEDMPRGCAITKHWDPLIWTFIALINSPAGDQVVGYEIGPNLTWISYEPTSGSVPQDEQQPFTVSFFSKDMPKQDYFVVLKIIHNAAGDRYDIPVYFTVGFDIAGQRGPEPPYEFIMDNPWPNPFNPIVRLGFSLPEQAAVELTIYDLSGRSVERLELGRLPPGRHRVLLDGDRLPSGLYFARLTAGNRIATKKILLLR